MANASSTAYFVVKCAKIESLKKAVWDNIWACCDRKNPPHPKDLLINCLKNGKVILIFSVNSCHGWHGYAEVKSEPGTVRSTVEECNVGTKSPHKTDSDEETSDSKGIEWFRFKIQWQRHFIKEHGEQCLPFTQTNDLNCSDGQTVNKARNFQRLSINTGEELCDKLDKYYEQLSLKKQLKIEEEKRKLPSPFFQPGFETDPTLIWDKLIHRVGSMGQVLLACPFGSQRYNLHTADSDVDMFVVYAADTKNILGFNPPQQTIKNRDTETCDYTIHEVHRYCELLISGDHRCTETLFLHPSSVYRSSIQWEELCANRKVYLTKQCAEKYMRDALGNKGVKALQKLEASKEAFQTPMPKKVAKLFYIIFRLLQNARDVFQGNNLKVYRDPDSPERQLLMDIRSSKVSYEDLSQMLKKLLEEITELKYQAEDTNDDFIKNLTEKWLLRLRFNNFKHDFPSESYEMK